ncbi:DUF5013 domain-containing protein [Parapedobacter sp. ISTM3]|uniref:DUF5013 domain-containing protein n=1 Tax=Parapedobacter luteus TaxID=623280 RepID=A0A1T4ZZB4_9SPHI|nr:MULTISPECIES: DUF5013 domain-containing protein [Parapedobacter]MBK1438826.1 DUF5013 domain-containing protein [Parapedobacter sp. ISTM3]SKB28060.1 protein of unknown function [Parapedobacter luteus]
MKKIRYILLGVTLMSVTSCLKTDNWDAPDVRVHGRVIDSYTGENLLSSQGDWGIRIWERTWTASTPNPQSLSVKQDGSYNNSKLFAGTYDMLPYGGPFWPVDTVKGVVLNGNTEQHFTVTPYLRLTDFEVSLNGLNLVMKCRLNAPIRVDLPNLVEIKPFLSLTTFSGATNFIDIPEYNNQRRQINKSWEEEVGDAETSDVYTIGPLPVKAGYTYYVRLGANVNDANRKYNYTEIIKVEVPADAQNNPDEVPDNYLSNAQWPFSRADWDGNRWGNLAGGWITNEAMRTRGGMGGYDGGWEGADNDKQSLGFERWGEGEAPIENGKLYQTLDLPAGQFRFTLSFAGDNPIISNQGSDPRYLAVAVGETLPDVEDISSALASANFTGVDNAGNVSVEFSLAAPTTVSAGFVVNFTGTEQNVRPSWIKLEKID